MQNFRSLAVAGLMGAGLAAASLGQADFVITRMAIPQSKVQLGGTFSLSVTVKNIGTRAGDGGYLDVWADRQTVAPSRTKGDRYIGVGWLQKGQEKVFAFAGLRVGTSPGRRYPRAYVDSQCRTGEIRENNNQMSLSFMPGAPDLVVSRGYTSPYSPTVGRPFMAYFVVFNQGTAPSVPSWFECQDSSPDHNNLGARVPSLAPGKSYTVSAYCAVRQSGTFRFNARCDVPNSRYGYPGNPELNENNNSLTFTYRATR